MFPRHSFSIDHPFRQVEDIMDELMEHNFERETMDDDDFHPPSLFRTITRRGTRIPIQEPPTMFRQPYQTRRRSREQFYRENGDTNEMENEDPILREAMRLSLEESAKQTPKAVTSIDEEPPRLEELTEEEEVGLKEAIRQSTLQSEPKSSEPKIELVEDDEDRDIEAALQESRQMEERRKRDEKRKVEVERQKTKQKKAEEGRQVERALRQEQDWAFQESLKQDQEKQQQLEKEFNEKISQELTKQEEEAIQLSLRLDRQRRLEQLAANLPPEPPVTEPNAAHLVVRLPDGQRIERRFLSTDKLLLLKDFIDSKSLEMTIPTSYELVTTFPKRSLNFNDTFKEAGLEGRSLVAVQSL